MRVLQKNLGVEGFPVRLSWIPLVRGLNWKRMVLAGRVFVGVAGKEPHLAGDLGRGRGGLQVVGQRAAGGLGALLGGLHPRPLVVILIPSSSLSSLGRPSSALTPKIRQRASNPRSMTCTFRPFPNSLNSYSDRTASRNQIHYFYKSIHRNPAHLIPILIVTAVSVQFLLISCILSIINLSI
jgi:hypothetical protein